MFTPGSMSNTGLLLSLSLLLQTSYADFQETHSTVLAKSYPGTAAWPSTTDWQTLNTTLSGTLIRYVNPAQACSSASYSTYECARYKVQQVLPNFVGSDPGLVLWPHFMGAPCSDTAEGSRCGKEAYLPSYVVAAKSAEDVAAGLKFANKRELRTIVKNTGHDILGRSVGRESISIWTRNIRGPIEYIPQWDGYTSTVDISGKWRGAALKYGAGYTWEDIYRAANIHNVTVVGGGELSVGAGGGWLQGGGHGPFSNQYGLGAEQVLEFEVVTPTGEIVTANEKAFSDLFWALRGGGGGTFGVVAKVTYKAYPVPQVTAMSLTLTPRGDSQAQKDALYDAYAYIWSQTPAMSDFGLSGYITGVSQRMQAVLGAPGKTVKEVNEFWDPIYRKLQTLDVSHTNFTVSPAMIDLAYNSGISFGGPKNPPFMEPNGISHSVGSRLLSAEKLRNVNLTHLSQVSRSICEADTMSIQYGVVMSSSSKFANRTWNLSLNPGWKESSVHMMAVQYPDVSSTAPKGVPVRSNRQILRGMWKGVDTLTSLLEPFSAGLGAYQNEASRFDKDWPQSFFGSTENYEKLLSIKKKYDPKSVLWCVACVGSEEFVEGDDGRLYRK